MRRPTAGCDVCAIAQHGTIARKAVNILRVIARLNVGGPARHVALLDAGLRARGHQTLLVHGALDPGEASLERLARESGVPMRYRRHTSFAP